MIDILIFGVIIAVGILYLYAKWKVSQAMPDIIRGQKELYRAINEYERIR